MGHNVLIHHLIFCLAYTFPKPNVFVDSSQAKFYYIAEFGFLSLTMV